MSPDKIFIDKSVGVSDAHTEMRGTFSPEQEQKEA